jgi:hypothetical protein
LSDEQSAFDNEKAQKERHENWDGRKNQSSCFKSKRTDAEKAQNKHHSKGLDSIAKEEAIKQKKVLLCPFCGDEFVDEDRVIQCIQVYHQDQLAFAFKLFRKSPLINDVNPSLPIFNVLTFQQVKIASSDYSSFQVHEVVAFLKEDQAEKFIQNYNIKNAPDYAAIYPRDLRK